MASKLNVWKAVKLLGVNSRGWFNVWELAGPAKSGVRAEIMSLLAGVKVPKAKAGVNALRVALYAVAAVPDGSYAAQDEAFKAWAKAVAAGPEPAADAA